MLSLDQLPQEIVELIAQNLDKSCLCSFRLVCRRLDKLSTYVVGNTLFGLVKSSLVGSSLSKLQAIASHSTYKRCLRHLQIEDDQEYCVSMTSETSWPRDTDGYIERDRLGIQELRRMLAADFSQCESLLIRDNSRSLVIVGDGMSVGTDIVHLTEAILEGHFLAITSLKIDFPGSAAYVHLRLEPGLRLQTSTVSWLCLQEAELDFESRYGTSGMEDGPRKLALSIFSSGARLRKLTLQSGMDPETPIYDAIVSSTWLLANLEQLHLFRARISSTLLLEVLKLAGGSLRSFEMYRSRVWSCASFEPILTTLRDRAPSLSRISLRVTWRVGPDGNKTYTNSFYGISKDPHIPGADGSCFEFPAHLSPNASGTPWVTYQGPDMQAALDILASSLYYRILTSTRE